MTWPRPKLIRTRLTLWYVFVLGFLLVASAAGASFILVWQLRAQLKRQAIQDLGKVEGLMYFRPDGSLHMHDDYYDFEESKVIQERFLEVLSPEGAILYRNKKLGSRTIDGPQFGA